MTFALIGMVLPMYILDNIAVRLMHYVPQGINSGKGVLLAITFFLFAIALSVYYGVLVDKYLLWLDNRKKGTQ